MHTRSLYNTDASLGSKRQLAHKVTKLFVRGFGIKSGPIPKNYTLWRRITNQGLSANVINTIFSFSPELSVELTGWSVAVMFTGRGGGTGKERQGTPTPSQEESIPLIT